MPKRKRTLADDLRVRMAVAREGSARLRSRSTFRTKRTMTLLLGAALSVGGVSQAFNDVHFVVQKNLDRVQVVAEDSSDRKVVANVQGDFAANSIYKLTRIFPDRLVTRESRLFDSAWLLPREQKAALEHQNDDPLGFGSTAIREQFFRTLPFGDLIHEKAEKYDVDPALVAAVVEAESRFKPRARSQVGAQGLMQLMPRTGRWMGAKDLYNPEENVDAGVKYLKYLQQRFDGNLNKTIAAYNAGEGNVRKFGTVPPYRETRKYVKKVMSNYQKRNAQLREFGQAAARDDEASALR